MKERRLVSVIEFFGAPGVGKTYLAKELVAHCRVEGILSSAQAIKVGAMPASERIYFKFSYIFPFLVMNPLLALAILRFVTSSGVRGAMAVVTVTINWFFVMAVVKRETLKNDIVVLDQGLAQAYWSMVFRGASVDELKLRTLLRRLLPVCDIDVFLVVDGRLGREGHLAQLASRKNGGSPLDDGDPKMFELGLEVAESVRNVLRGLVGGAAKPRMVMLEYANEGSSNIKELYERLRNSAVDPNW